MVSFNSSLLREKFTIHDPLDGSSETGAPVLALSNRMVVELVSKSGQNKERFIIRTHNMHSCVRIAARLIRTYHTTGPILVRGKDFEWEAIWDQIVNEYEYEYNPSAGPPYTIMEKCCSKPVSATPSLMSSKSAMP
ncbi:MAG: hypothetical protein LRY62_00280 [Alphaproteobacteria bacterium]|nr:hypothetical protein [Alphaproteobacteria bacterium]